MARQRRYRTRNSPVRRHARRFDLFGHRVAVESVDAGWVVYYIGDEGKRRRATDIVVPPTVSDQELQTYLSDLCHEWASARNPEVVSLDER